MKVWFSKWWCVMIYGVQTAVMFVAGCANYVLYKTTLDTALVVTLALGWAFLTVLAYREVKNERH